MSMENEIKTMKPIGQRGKHFSSEYQPESNGRPKGSISLETRVRRLLEGDEKLPEAIAETIKKAVGTDKKALDAIIIVGILQALQGDKNWAQLILDRGFGKVADKTIHAGDSENPVVVTGLADLIASQDGKTKTLKE